MAQMSSEEALNGIFNILDTMVNQHEEKKKETLEQKADSTIVSLVLLRQLKMNQQQQSENSQRNCQKVQLQWNQQIMTY